MEINEEYYRVRAYIHQEAFRKNLRQVRKAIGPDPEIMAVIKADGYGHGVANLIPILKEEGIKRAAVATVDEALELQNQGLEAAILILGYTSPEDAEILVRHQIRPAVFTYDMAKALSEEALRQKKPALIHIALDTGMRRIGFRCTQEAADTICRISQLPGIEIEGLFTHFARADETDKTAARKQLEEYEKMAAWLEERGVRIPLHHVSNSAAIMELKEAHFNMVRAGIILYGLTPSNEMDTKAYPLYPVMELKTHVIYIKEIQDGDCVSYGGTFKAKGPRLIGTIPVGYADGYSRLLSGKGRVLIRGQYAPIAGRVCMDQFMVDLTDVPGVKEGDEVTLFGEGLPLDELASVVGTINYELACQVSKRVPRVPCP